MSLGCVGWGGDPFLLFALYIGGGCRPQLRMVGNSLACVVLVILFCLASSPRFVLLYITCEVGA